jgi:hypothetical protein
MATKLAGDDLAEVGKDAIERYPRLLRARLVDDESPYHSQEVHKLPTSEQPH